MTYLYQALAQAVDDWRAAHYPCDRYPALREILEFAADEADPAQLRFLRRAQLRALETYWYLRLVRGTPTIPRLYEELFPSLPDRLRALGVSAKLYEEAEYDYAKLLERVRTDNAFVRRHQLESLRETLTLDYPSYILALAMGAGKTILMGAIVATEFALALEYDTDDFVQNALIFAPGKTILSALRQLADIPYDRLLPPRLHRPFAASFKLTFTSDDKPTINITWGSLYNVIVTNTEKIRIQKPTVRGNGSQLDWLTNPKAEEAAELANLRLQAIASLPHLAVFSDEAHHTYGQKLLGKWEKDKTTGEDVFKDDGIKKVRRTIDYLHRETNLIVVVNATGTPYFERQPLRDVVVWYGLREGIHDGVLKELANNIKVFELSDEEAPQLVTAVIDDFVERYWPVRLPDGAPARLALYFPNLETRDELRGPIESALALRGIGTDTLLAVDGKSPESVKHDLYAAGYDPASPHRVLLLVNMGTEGWNCPSLFATALVRKLANSNNFVLQAATRCLRQVPGNTVPARLYLTAANKKTLEAQLAETYGTNLKDLDGQQAERVEQEIVLRKPDLPPLLIRRRVNRVRPRESAGRPPLAFTLPTIDPPQGIRVDTYSIAETGPGQTRLFRIDAGEETLPAGLPALGLYAAASELAGNYHLPTREVAAALRACYGPGLDIPAHHLPELGRQIEAQRADYETWQEHIEVAVALVKAGGFDRQERDGDIVYTARISYARERAGLGYYALSGKLPTPELARNLSFHTEGYNFDSLTERDFLERTLALLSEHPERIEGVWFTGGLTDPGKTDLYVEYLSADGRWRRYTPDFVIRRADGKFLIVEIKKDALSPDIQADLERHAAGQPPQSAEGRKVVALKRWENLNPDALAYEVMFEHQLDGDGMTRVRDFILGH